MKDLIDLGHGILKGKGKERPDTERVFIPFPKGLNMDKACDIEESLNPEPLEHHHVELIDVLLYLHVRADKKLEQYTKMKAKLANA